MPDETWRDELQEYALLVEAVSSGDRSKVVKLFGDYILRKKAAEAIEEAVAEIEARVVAEPEYGGEEDEVGNLGPGEGYDEGYTAAEYDDYYDDDETNAHQNVHTKRVRFADDGEGGGAEDEYYGEDGYLLYDDHGNDYDDNEDGYYEEDGYSQEDYAGEEDSAPYMSGALPSEQNEIDEYNPESYGDEYDYDSYSGAYDQENQFGNNAGHHGQYKDNYGTSTAANGYVADEYHDSTQDEGFYDYNVDEGFGGEWSKIFNENERVTNDEVQENGINNNNYELVDPYGYDMAMPQADELKELHDLLGGLQQKLNAHEHDAAEARQSEEFTEEDNFPDYGGDRYEEESGELGYVLQRPPYQDNEAEPVQERSILKQLGYPDDEEGPKRNNYTLGQARDPGYEESNYNEAEDSDFWNDDPADQANIHGHFEDFDHLQRQPWDEDLEGEDEDEEDYDEADYDENYVPQPINAEREWADSVRPHFDGDGVVPFPGFHRSISNEQVLPYAITPGDRFDTNLRRNSMEEVNPNYNVFEAGQRFYDHYSNSREECKRDAKRTIQRGTLHPLSLVDKFRERLYGS